VANELQSGLSCRHEYFPDANVACVRGISFPAGDSGWLFWLIRINPLTYGVAGLRRFLYEQPLPVTPELPSMMMCLGVTVMATVPDPVVGETCFSSQC
jgi:hypothetical protein